MTLLGSPNGVMLAPKRSTAARKKGTMLAKNQAKKSVDVTMQLGSVGSCSFLDHKKDKTHFKKRWWKSKGAPHSPPIRNEILIRPYLVDDGG